MGVPRSVLAALIVTQRLLPSGSVEWQGIPTKTALTFALFPISSLSRLHWSSRRMIFVNSMSDLFHEEVPDDYFAAVVDVMMKANWHTYQVLTKRSSRMQALLQTNSRSGGLPHIWWGVSVENRKHGLPRIEHLRQTPARVRFLSVEPLLEDLGCIDLPASIGSSLVVRAVSGQDHFIPNGSAASGINVVVAGVPFFFKQWGGVRKGRCGRELDGRTYDEFPQIPSPIRS